MPWLDALRHTSRAALEVERQFNEPKRAARGAFAVALLIFPLLAASGPRPATSAAMGGFIAGIATFQRSFRPRPALALTAGIGLGVSTFLGYLAVGVTGLFLLLLAVWSFAAGLAWSMGPTAGVLAANTVTVMLVVVQLPVSVSTAVGHALLCSLGGAVQALVIIVLPLRSWGAHRDALADAYAELAHFARRLRHDPRATLDPEPLMEARHAEALTPWQERRRPPELPGLRGIAERIRPTLAAIAEVEFGRVIEPLEPPPAFGREVSPQPSDLPEDPELAEVEARLSAAAEAENEAEYDRSREVLAGAAQMLDALARAIRTGDPVAYPRSAPATLAPSGRQALRGPALRAARLMTTLLGRAADELERSRETPLTGPVAGHDGVLRRPGVARMVPVAIRTGWRQIQLGTPVLHHAVRLSGVVTTAYLLAKLTGLHHSYWAAMTAAMVIRPDFRQTYSRGMARVLGTLTGVVVATAVVELAHPNQWVSCALAVLFMSFAYLLLRTGYAVITTFVSGYVVFLLSLEPGSAFANAWERVLMTLLGGAVALVAYALFPTWETVRLPERTAEWIAAVGRYAGAVLAGYGDPAGRDPRTVRAALLATREARAEFLQARERAAAEPVALADRHPQLTRKQLGRAREALGYLSRVALLMEAHLPGAAAEPVPGAAEFGALLTEATAAAGAAVLTGTSVDFTPLRAAYQEWEDAEMPATDLELEYSHRGTSEQQDVVRSGCRLLLAALGELERALQPRS
ncbi:MULTISPECIES: FUSC family protein [Kitasatospora]|uniref:FUSC family protein n=1 Tax=Kitasatospora TaxID=2063 RepID=UPI000C710575|nr:FUSC family protein [Kitasatospora sp. GP30]MDH6141615.1 putative membrane protein YccC [Kitasatospora sp. GP30]